MNGSGVLAPRVCSKRAAVLLGSVLAISASVLHAAEAAPDEEVRPSQQGGREPSLSVADDIVAPGETESSVTVQIERAMAALEYEQASRAATSAIEATERLDRYAPELEHLYLLLGDAAFASGDGEAALTAYDSALFHARLVHGLNDVAQLDVVYRQAETHIKRREIRKATERLEYAYQIAVRNHGADHLATKPALVRLADWYAEVRHPQIARRLYLQLAEMENIDASDLTPENLAHQIRMGRSYLLQAFPSSKHIHGRPLFEPKPHGVVMPESALARETSVNRLGPGRRAYEKAIEIAAHLYGENSREHGLARVAMGDWWLLFRRWRPAFEHYAAAWEILGQVDSGLRERVLGEPVALFDLHLGSNRRLVDSDEPPKMGSAEYSYSISHRGLVEKIETLWTKPDDFDVFGHRRRLALIRYRPAFRDGQPVETADHRRVAEFKY